jgi:hypothetical protein
VEEEPMGVLLTLKFAFLAKKLPGTTFYI